MPGPPASGGVQAVNDPNEGLLKQWRYRVFAATWLSYFGFYFCRKPFFVAKAQFTETFGWDEVMLGNITVAYLIAYAVGQFLAGWAGNRFGPRRVLLVGMGASIACNVAFGFSSTPAAFVGLLIVLGFAQATGWSNNVGTMARWFRRSERGSVMGVWATNFQVGGVAATALAGFIAAPHVLDLPRLGIHWPFDFGWRGSFFTGAAVLAVIWVFFFFNMKNSPDDLGVVPLEDFGEHDETTSEVQKPEAPWSTQLMINIGLIGLFYFFVKFIRYAIWSWAPLLLKQEYGMEIDEAAYISTLFDLGGVAGVFLCGYLSDRFFGGRRVAISFIFIGGMTISCGLLYTLGAQSVVLFATSMALIGFTLYGPDALMSGAGAMDVGSARKAVVAAGVINGMGSFGAVLQELVLGRVLNDGDASQVFAVLLASALLAAFCLGILLFRNSQGQADM